MRSGDKMSTKNKVLELLEKNRGRHLSGEVIAGRLNISRSAVWKAINSLKQDGYDIQAMTNRGYFLSSKSNILSIQGLFPFLLNESYAEKINVYKSLESTNKTAKEMALKGCEHGTVVITDHQTAGKGRFGRSFYSPPESGLYMSIILRPGFINLPSVTMITSATAVVVCRAVQTVTGQNPGIKWVNDILLNDKKICGILTEAVTDFESGGVEWIVVGIGININTTDFPGDLNEIAASIVPYQMAGSVRNRLAAEIVNSFLSSDTWINNKDVFTEYKSKLAMLGSKVTVNSGNETFEAVALDIDEACRLIVQKENGKTLVLSSGEVSIKRIPGT